MATSIPVDSIHDVIIEEIGDDKESRARAAFSAAWNLTKNGSRKTKRFVINHGHKAIKFGKAATVTALIIAAALLFQYVISAGIMAVFSLGFLASWWLAALPTFLLLLSTIGFVQEIAGARAIQKQLDTTFSGLLNGMSIS
jgi:hypothetical protein